MGHLEEGLWDFGMEVRRVARGSTEGQQMMEDGRRPSCGHGITWRGEEWQCDTPRLQPTHEL